MKQGEALRPIRPVYVYVKTPTTMDKLKVGDLFSMGPATKEDEIRVCLNDVYVVEEGGEPKPQEGKPEGYFMVSASRLVKDPDFGGTA